MRGTQGQPFMVIRCGGECVQLSALHLAPLPNKQCSARLSHAGLGGRWLFSGMGMPDTHMLLPGLLIGQDFLLIGQGAHALPGSEHALLGLWCDMQFNSPIDEIQQWGARPRCHFQATNRMQRHFMVRDSIARVARA